MIRCVFFDRDGIVNQSPGPGYVERWEDFHLMPEFPAILRNVSRLGFAAILITNQRGVALGKMTAAAVEDIHRRFRRALKDEYGLEILDVFYCPHDKNECECRKPKPGMLLEAARRHNINLAESWMIGDSPKDVEAGKAAGCRTILVGDAEATAPPDYRFANMAALASAIAKLLEAG